MSPRWPLERSRERYWFVADVTWVTVCPGKIHANRAASKWAALQKRETFAQYRTFSFFGGWIGNQRGDSCLAWFTRPVNQFSVYSSSFIIICPFLDKLIGTAVKEPDCLSTAPPPTPLLCCSLILSGSCWDRGEIPWNVYKRKPERRCPSSARDPWGIKTRFEWLACVGILSGLPTWEGIRIKDVKITYRAAELTASSWPNYVGDNHLLPVCCGWQYIP